MRRQTYGCDIRYGNHEIEHGNMVSDMPTRLSTLSHMKSHSPRAEEHFEHTEHELLVVKEDMNDANRLFVPV